MDTFARCAFSFVAGACFGLMTTAVPWLNDELAAPLTYPTPHPAATPIAKLYTMVELSEPADSTRFVQQSPAPTAFAPVPVSPVAWAWYVPDGCHPALTFSPLCDRPTPNPDHMGR